MCVWIFHALYLSDSHVSRFAEVFLVSSGYQFLSQRHHDLVVRVEFVNLALFVKIYLKVKNSKIFC